MISLVISLFIQNAMACDTRDREVSSICKQIIRISGKSEIGLEYAKQIVRFSKHHGIDPKLYTAILAQESMFVLSAYNTRTKDYGIAQISHRNVEVLKLNKWKLLHDHVYSIRQGASILAYFSKRYKKLEKNWFCRYNVGTGNRVKLKRVCDKYTRLVRRFL